MKIRRHEEDKEEIGPGASCFKFPDTLCVAVYNAALLSQRVQGYICVFPLTADTDENNHGMITDYQNKQLAKNNSSTVLGECLCETFSAGPLCGCGYESVFQKLSLSQIWMFTHFCRLSILCLISIHSSLNLN